jgi:hypothetical protein
VGRFLNEDRLQEYVPIVGGAAYSYVSNSPIIFTDPFELAQTCKEAVRRGHTEMVQTWREYWQLIDYLRIPILSQSLLLMIKHRRISWADAEAVTIIEWQDQCAWALYFESTAFVRQYWTKYKRCWCPDSLESWETTTDGLNKTYTEFKRIERTFGTLFHPCRPPETL